MSATLGRVSLLGAVASGVSNRSGKAAERRRARPPIERRQRSQIGSDLLFAVANLARKFGVEAESALRDANLKFTRRFHYVEGRAAEDGVPLAEAGLERLDGYWNEIRAKDQA
jgi:uncharacterized protein YabN with tetrapyrrole methylase and pyrophosphatase domain